MIFAVSYLLFLQNFVFYFYYLTLFVLIIYLFSKLHLYSWNTFFFMLTSFMFRLESQSKNFNKNLPPVIYFCLFVLLVLFRPKHSVNLLFFQGSLAVRLRRADTSHAATHRQAASQDGNFKIMTSLKSRYSTIIWPHLSLYAVHDSRLPRTRKAGSDGLHLIGWQRLRNDLLSMLFPCWPVLTPSTGANFMLGVRLLFVGTLRK